MHLTGSHVRPQTNVRACTHQEKNDRYTISDGRLLCHGRSASVTKACPYTEELHLSRFVVTNYVELVCNKSAAARRVTSEVTAVKR